MIFLFVDLSQKSGTLVSHLYFETTEGLHYVSFNENNVFGSKHVGE